MTVNRMEAHEITTALIAYASGMSKYAIGKTMGRSDSTIARSIKLNTARLGVFKMIEGSNNIFELSNKRDILDINGTLVSLFIQTTGNISDGVIICNETYCAKATGDCEVDDNNLPIFSNGENAASFSYSASELGLLRIIRCGVVLVRDKNDARIKGFTHSDETYSGEEDTLFVQEPFKQKDEPKEVKPVSPEIKPIWNASNRFISITVGRQTYNADSSHPEFKTALDFLFDDKVQDAIDVINKEQKIKKYVKGNVTIENSKLYYKNIEIRSGLATRIITAMDEGKDFEFFLPFLENLMLNPSSRAVNRLFDFLQANDIKISKDGYIIAWKKVREDFKDIFTGKMDNSVGQTVSMPRNQVNEDDTVTCSNGLHVCAKSYLDQYAAYSGNRVVKVKLHPRDVVSIPVDYNNAKLRCCEYTVVEAVK